MYSFGSRILVKHQIFSPVKYLRPQILSSHVVTHKRHQVSSTELKSEHPYTIRNLNEINEHKFDQHHPNLEESDIKLSYPYTLNDTDDISQRFFEQYVSHELGIKKEDARKIYFLFTDQIKANHPNNESIIHLCRFLKLFFTPEDIVLNPKPFLIPFQNLYNNILILKEIGFRSFQISMMDYTSELIGLKASQLKKYFNYPEEQNCFESVCKVLEIYGETKLEIMELLQNTFECDNLEDIPISELRILCAAHYLSTILDVSFKKTYHFCLRHASALNEINLSTMKINISLLKNNFQISNNKILNYGLFVSMNPENLTMISTKLKPIVGDHIYENLISIPQVLKLEFPHIVQNYKLIKEKCNGVFLTRSIELLSMDTDKLGAVFKELETNEDIKQAKVNLLGWDYLAINRNKILGRIDTIKSNDIPFRYVPLSFFCDANDPDFERMISDMTKDTELRIKFFLYSRFDLDYEKIKHRLYVIPGSNTEKYSYQNANRIIEFLISQNIDKDLIINFIYLILFDYKQLKQSYFQLCNNNKKSIMKDQMFFQHLSDHLQANISKTSFTKKTK